MDNNYYQEEYSKLSLEEKKLVHILFLDLDKGGKFFDKRYITLKNLIFTHTPPTPEEFLDYNNGFISYHTANGLYDHVKRDFIQGMRTQNPYSVICMYGSTRCEAKGTKILMFDMSIKNIEDIQIGDLLLGDDSTPRQVLNLHKGFGKLYKIKQNKGDDYIVNENHILVLQHINKKIIEISVKDYLNLSKDQKSLLKGIRVNLKKKYNFIKTIIQIEEYGNGEFYGFELDGNHRYLHSDLTITHNSGKSVLARLFVLYTIIFVNYLRDPHLYFGINKMSKITIWLLSFKEDKTKELLLDPLLLLLDDTPKFQREHFEKAVKEKKINNEGIIHFSEAGKFGAITFPNLKIATGRDPSSIVGSDIIAGVISELTFFKKYVPGLTDEDIMQVYTKLYNRIMNTIGHSSFPCWTYLDSSANDADSPLEKHILTKIKNDKNSYFQHYCLWELRPHLYKEYNFDRSKTFKMFVGDTKTSPKIIESDFELNDLSPDLILNVPIDLKQVFETDPIESIRDIAGRPTTSESKFIQNYSLIDKLFDNSSLINIEGIIIADSSQNPKNLLWNKIKDLMFICYNGINYNIRRAAKEPRFAGIDLAYSAKGDIAGITILHKEYDFTNKSIIYVCDMSFAIGPGEEGINLEAIIEFFKDLYQIGGIYFSKIGSDTFQSQTMIQALTREKFEIEKVSVDRSIDPYMFLYSCLLQKSPILKCGKNIFLRNNLKSLYRKRLDNGKEKIDHNLGKTENNYYGNWDISSCGINAKDVSDSLVSALWLAKEDNSIPMVDYNKENDKFSNNPEKIFKPNLTEMYGKLNKIYTPFGKSFIN